MQCGNARVMSVSGKSNRKSFEFSCLSGSRSPMIYAVNRRVTKSRLKPVGIFSQIMQQTGQLGFIGQIQRRGKFTGEYGDVGQMRFQRLPFARSFW